MRFLFTVLLSLVLALPAAARQLTEAEQAGLTKAIDAYGRATMSKNAEKIVATIPPRVLNVFAGTAGIEASQIKETLVAQTKELMKTNKISEFVTAPGPFVANDAKLDDGTDVVWVVVPTQFVAESDGKKNRHSQPLLALFEGDRKSVV